MKEVILATRNPSKALQIQTLFNGSTVSVLTLDAVGIEGKAVERTGDDATIEENALTKALFAHEKSGSCWWAMSDDTGLFINALGGEPGVDAAYWGGKALSTEERMAHCLKLLQGVADRSAVFRVVVVVISPEGVRHYFSGEVAGHLLESPRVPPQPEMPYSALFVPEGQDLSFAEMTTEQENEIYHRGMAFRKVRDFFGGQN